MGYWAEAGTFLKQYRRHFRDTGALLPSSRYLALALVSEFRKPRPSCRILEVGPGTGSVTRQIVQHMQLGDHLDAVEINGEFVKLLEQRFNKESAFRSRRDRLTLIHSAIENVKGEATYDFIVSGLPLNNFPPGLVRDIFKSFTRLLKPGGTLSYFEYALVRQMKLPFVNRQERRRLCQVGRVVGKYIHSCQIRKQQVYINVPPAIVRHLRLKPLDSETGFGKPNGEMGAVAIDP